MDDKEVLVKLGMAIYLHKALIKRAQKGCAAVKKLKKKGVFPAKKKGSKACTK